MARLDADLAASQRRGCSAPPSKPNPRPPLSRKSVLKLLQAACAKIEKRPLHAGLHARILTKSQPSVLAWICARGLLRSSSTASRVRGPRLRLRSRFGIVRAMLVVAVERPLGSARRAAPSAVTAGAACKAFPSGLNPGVVATKRRTHSAISPRNDHPEKSPLNHSTGQSDQ